MGKRGHLIAVTSVLLVTMAPKDTSAHPGSSARISQLSHQIHHAPRDADLYLSRAAQYREDGRLQRAKMDIRTAARLSPHDPDVRFERALTHEAAGAWSSAARDLDAVVRMTEDPSADAFTARARVRLALGLFTRARADLSQAISLAPTPSRVLMRADLDRDHADLSNEVEGLTSGLAALGSAAVVQLRLVDALSRAGQHDSASATLAPLLRAHPHRADLRLTQAQIAKSAGSDGAAIVYTYYALFLAQRAIARRPTALHHVTLGQVALALGDVHSARAACNHALAQHPDLKMAQDLSFAIEAKEST